MLRFRKTVINSTDDGPPYLVRWSLSCPLGSIKLHHILRSDEDRDCHDHPWSFLSVILQGGYWEHRPTNHRWMQPGADPAEMVSAARETVRCWYGPGRILWRPAPSVHRLELPAGRTAWSLVFTGPSRREWGFHTICGWIPWMRYNQAKAEGC